MFTKQHFRQIADMIKLIKNKKDKADQIEHYCSMFLQDNPRFDKSRFIQYIETGSDKVSRSRR